MLEHVFHTEWRLVYHAVLLFAVGLFAGVAVVRLGLDALLRPAVTTFRWVVRLVGPGPSLLRMTLVIWLFNSAAICAYMCSGVLHHALPMLFCIWTGMNIAGITGLMHTGRMPVRGIMLQEDQWSPPPGLGGLCGLAVLVLEMGSFWTAIAMGISMGNAVATGTGRLAALGPRIGAYLSVLVPVLLLSALCEAIAIRDSAVRTNTS
jgi:hypothetical protein